MRLRLRRLLLCLFALTALGVLYLHALLNGHDVPQTLRRVLSHHTFVRHFPIQGLERGGANVWDFSETNDRIVDQMKYIPAGLEADISANITKPKVIFLYGGIGDFGVKLGKKEFQRQECPVQNCMITDSPTSAEDADALLFRHAVDVSVGGERRNKDQIWIFYALEAPYSLPGYGGLENMFNWTATYRRDSTIVAPYAKWVPFDPPVVSPSLDRNFAAGKTKQVAWFVSNCGANNNRLEYAQELGKYIDVDIFGVCGNDDCPKNNQDCWEKLNEEYKFYLAFENSNCRDYITEKFFLNGLGYDVIPIVMGARPDDYRQVAPPHSYINVDDFVDPKSLADYLIKLDNNDRKYNQYFRWKGTGKFINTKFWCRVCALLNDKEKPTKIVEDLQAWWNNGQTCQRKPWTATRKF